MTEEPDSRLVKAVAGDGDALSTLLLEHGPAVQSRLDIGRRWRTLLEAEDVMQVTYLEAFRNIARFDLSRPTPFAGWLSRIAQNNLRDAIRGLQRQKQLPPDRRISPAAGADSRIQLLELLGATSATPSREAGRDEMTDILDAAIDRLPPDYAAVVQAYDLDGKSISQVAEQVGRTPGAVHMLRARAYDCLREMLGSESLYFS